MRKFCIFLGLLCCLATATARQKVALVLGGGGAKGAAEVGVLKVIERTGIPIDLVVGTSIGSIVGGLYSCGYTAAQLDTMFCTQEWLSLLTDRNEEMGTEPYKVKDGVTYIFGFPVVDLTNNAFGIVRGERIEQLLDSMTGCRRNVAFDSLRIPFRCVAVDLKTASEEVMSSGRLSRAMRASMAIPGLYKPVNIDGKMLVDGGMLNNLPTDVARQLGADVVIAVDLQQAKPKERTFSLKDELGIGGLLDWIVSRPDVKKYHENVKKADIYIHPPLPDYDASSFGNKNAARMMTIGEREAQKHWQELMELKERLKAEAC